MATYDCRRFFSHRSVKYFAWVNGCAQKGSPCDHDIALGAVFRIEHENVKFFIRKVSKAG